MPNAGGRATEAGMAFQAKVSTWFAAQLVSQMPVGGRFGLRSTATPQTIQFETGAGLDDVLVKFSDGEIIYAQCKTTAGLTKGEESPFGETIEQVVRFVVGTSEPLDPLKTTLVLAVADDAPRTLDQLETGCRAFDTGGSWSDVLATLSEAQNLALGIFRLHIDRIWPGVAGGTPTPADYSRLARLFRVMRFDLQTPGRDWSEAARTLGDRIYGGEDRGAAPLEALLALVRDLIRKGAPSDRQGLLDGLRTRCSKRNVPRLSVYWRGTLRSKHKHQRALTAGVILLLQDVDRPGDGFIAVSEQPMIDVYEPRKLF